MVAEPGTERGARRGRDVPGRAPTRDDAGPGPALPGAASVASPASARRAPVPRVASRRAVLIVALTAACLIVLDVLTKLLAVAELSGRRPVEIIPGILDLRLTRNSGAAFSLAGGATVILSLVALVVVGVVVVTARRLASVGWAFVFGAMVGGAVGNLIDRVFRSPGPLRGHVVDFVHIHHWPIFNLADSAIVCGGVLAVILSLRGIGLDGTRLTAVPAEPAATNPTATNPTATNPTGAGSAAGAAGGGADSDAGPGRSAGAAPGERPDAPGGRHEGPGAR
ncbi:signal peptidase II [Parafrankia colletiae]|uniref:Lipoprotein signal peptidase n=1 Tax=Parafrankia colletiae TaxID=573497 RepID=A0A1S1REN7_9ACTN|nr:signal peptidase II [Parafrankia colletiae]MCK9900488.1 signal peptidase II [Frankia sp. Cpl3]OHV43294.1 signal peptidase II [Parafrankia colletiae]